MKLTKALCGATAVLTVLSSTAIAAQAEQQQLKLQTGNIGNINWTDSSTYYFGDGCFSDGSKFYRIGEKEISEWQNTGNFTYSNIEADLDITGLNWWSGSFDGEGEYVQFYKHDAENNVLERYVVHLDKAAGKIKTAYTLPAGWCYTIPNGYTISDNEVSENELEIITFDPSGKKTAKKITYDNEMWYSLYATKGGEYLGYLMFKPVEVPGSNVNFELYAVNKKGELELLHRTENSMNATFALAGTADNALLWENGPRTWYFLYSTEDKTMYDLGQSLDGSNGMFINGLNSSIYNKKAVVEFLGMAEVDGENKQIKKYALVDLSKTDGKGQGVISNSYSSMSTEDGKIYLVQNENGKWGYIDSSGKELAMFDDAGSFIGDYAPVVKNGKAYLIDRNMNKVSEEIDGNSVSTRGYGLYFVANGDSGVFMTYSKPNETSEPTSKPTSETASKPSTSEPSVSGSTSETVSKTASEPTSQSGSDKNPATGFAFALIPVALIGGVSIVALKKRK